MMQKIMEEKMIAGTEKTKNQNKQKKARRIIPPKDKNKLWATGAMLTTKEGHRFHDEDALKKRTAVGQRRIGHHCPPSPEWRQKKKEKKTNENKRRRRRRRRTTATTREERSGANGEWVSVDPMDMEGTSASVVPFSFFSFSLTAFAVIVLFEARRGRRGRWRGMGGRRERGGDRKEKRCKGTEITTKTQR